MPTDPASIDPAGQPVPISSVFYDSAGRVIKAIDPPGTITYTAYPVGRGPDAAAPPGSDEPPPDEPHIVGD